MTSRLTFSIILLALAVASAPAIAADVSPIAACQVQSPTGDYAVVMLTVDVPGAKAIGRTKDTFPYVNWTLTGSLRNSRMRICDRAGITEPDGWMERKGDNLTAT